MTGDVVPLVPFTAGNGVVWFPESLREAVHGDDNELSSWSYIIVEELVDAMIVLHRWPWPLADQRGGLFWVEDDGFEHDEAVVALAALVQQLYRPAEQLTRRPRPGDAFATRRVGEGWGGESMVSDLRSLLPEAVYDISAEAYEAARLAYQTAVSTVLPSEHDEAVAHILSDQAAERRSRRAPPLRVAARPQPGDQR